MVFGSVPFKAPQENGVQSDYSLDLSSAGAVSEELKHLLS